MKKKELKALLAVLGMSLAVAGCGAQTDEAGGATENVVDEVVKDSSDAGDTEVVVTPSDKETAEEEEENVDVEETPAVTEAPTSTPEPTMTPAPTPTQTPTPTATPAPTFVITPMEPVTMYASVVMYVRTGPGTEYDVAGTLEMNQAVTVVGRADNGWYCIELNGQLVYGTDSYLVSTPIPTATPAPTATPVPTPTMTPVPTEAPVVVPTAPAVTEAPVATATPVPTTPPVVSGRAVGYCEDLTLQLEALAREWGYTLLVDLYGRDCKSQQKAIAKAEAEVSGCNGQVFSKTQNPDVQVTWDRWVSKFSSYGVLKYREGLVACAVWYNGSEYIFTMFYG